MRLAQFLLGVLVFAGYAQQSGAQHVLSPRRSRLVTAAGIHAGRANPEAEVEVYQELGRRFAEAGDGWREEELPWTPSFLPWLLSQVNPYRDGPTEVLKRALALRESPAVDRYRRLRRQLLSSDSPNEETSRDELSAAADSVARALDAERGELEVTRHIVVEVLPKAVGVVAGGVAGAAVAGPPGAVAGGLAGLVGEEVLKPIQNRLFGWVLDRLPFYSARKLLARAARAEANSGHRLRSNMMAVWASGDR